MRFRFPLLHATFSLPAKIENDIDRKEYVNVYSRHDCCIIRSSSSLVMS
jgi:hypothetical protein